MIHLNSNSVEYSNNKLGGPGGVSPESNNETKEILEPSGSESTSNKLNEACVIVAKEEEEDTSTNPAAGTGEELTDIQQLVDNIQDMMSDSMTSSTDTNNPPPACVVSHVIMSSSPDHHLEKLFTSHRRCSVTETTGTENNDEMIIEVQGGYDFSDVDDDVTSETDNVAVASGAGSGPKPVKSSTVRTTSSVSRSHSGERKEKFGTLKSESPFTDSCMTLKREDVRKERSDEEVPSPQSLIAANELSPCINKRPDRLNKRKSVEQDTGVSSKLLKQEMTRSNLKSKRGRGSSGEELTKKEITKDMGQQGLTTTTDMSSSTRSSSSRTRYAQSKRLVAEQIKLPHPTSIHMNRSDNNQSALSNQTSDSQSAMSNHRPDISSHTSTTPPSRKSPLKSMEEKKHAREGGVASSDLEDERESSPALSKTQLEILELEMRARAIKAMLKAQEELEKHKQKRREGGGSPCEEPGVTQARGDEGRATLKYRGSSSVEDRVQQRGDDRKQTHRITPTRDMIQIREEKKQKHIGSPVKDMSRPRGDERKQNVTKRNERRVIEDVYPTVMTAPRQQDELARPKVESTIQEVRRVIRREEPSQARRLEEHLGRSPSPKRRVQTAVKRLQSDVVLVSDRQVIMRHHYDDVSSSMRVVRPSVTSPVGRVVKIKQPPAGSGRRLVSMVSTRSPAMGRFTEDRSREPSMDTLKSPHESFTRGDMRRGGQSSSSSRSTAATTAVTVSTMRSSTSSSVVLQSLRRDKEDCPARSTSRRTVVTTQRKPSNRSR